MALLGYQSLGVVYGDIGTSPLYTFSSFTLPDPGADDVLGIHSLILWTLTLVSLVKYVFIVLHADDHGEGIDTLCLDVLVLYSPFYFFLFFFLGNCSSNDHKSFLSNCYSNDHKEGW